jgi:hypothetical protein
MRRRACLGITAGLVLIAGLERSTSPAPPPGFLHAFPWSVADPLFGGLSALEVSADGSRFVALSDKGNVTRGSIQRDAEGRIAQISVAAFQHLADDDGAALPPGRTDSEGLAISEDGHAFISFEGPARVKSYARLDAASETLPDSVAFLGMEDNAALEALAIAADGTLYTVPESMPEADPFPLFRFRKGQWDIPFPLARIGNFLPVGADIGPDGRLYLLERQFRGLAGFASRLRRFDLTAQGESKGTILLQTAPGVHDNLEGVAIWRDDAGRLTATMVSDNNFLDVLATEIVEYRLPD